MFGAGRKEINGLLLCLLWLHAEGSQYWWRWKNEPQSHGGHSPFKMPRRNVGEGGGNIAGGITLEVSEIMEDEPLNMELGLL